jgi:hypothetical protein
MGTFKKEASQVNSELITTPQAAQIMGVSPTRVLQYVRGGRLPAVRKGPIYLYDPEVVRRFASEGRKPVGRYWPPKEERQPHKVERFEKHPLANGMPTNLAVKGGSPTDSLASATALAGEGDRWPAVQEKEGLSPAERQHGAIDDLARLGINQEEAVAPGGQDGNRPPTA